MECAFVDWAGVGGTGGVRVGGGRVGEGVDLQLEPDFHDVEGGDAESFIPS